VYDQITGMWAGRALAPAGGGHVPTWVWVGYLALIIASAVAFRPGRGVDQLWVLVVKVLGLAGAWLWLIALTIGFAV
jgi:hypothetical protein